MEGNLTVHSSANNLLRLKKSLQFISEVVRSYEIGLYDHVGFSCAIAISKAEELKSCVSHASPAFPIFTELISALKHLYRNQTDGQKAVQLIEKIHLYFKLYRYELVPKKNSISATPP